MKGETYWVHKDKCLLSSYHKPKTNQGDGYTKGNLENQESIVITYRNAVQELLKGVWS